jgi:SAM-dependent methyltransferase
LSSTEDGLVCSKRHRFEAVDGVFDLWPADRPVPRGDPFSGPYGEVYDRAIKERWLARVGGRLGWGADVGAMFRLMDEGVKCAPGEVVLDVPIGGGPSLRAAAGRMEGTLIGIDLSLAMLHRATEVVHEERLERVVLARGDATRLPIASASVDRILCFNGLHVLPNKREALAEFQRVLKPGGEVWGSVVVKHPTARWARPWFNAAWWFFHPADPGELDRLAEQTGFKRWETERSGSLMLFRGRRSNKPATGLKKR